MHPLHLVTLSRLRGMLVSDYIVRVLAKEAGIRGLVCVTTNLVNDAVQRHEATPTAAAALGHILTAGILLGALLKVSQRVALKVESKGAIRKMLAEADAYGRVRGYVLPNDVGLVGNTSAEDVAAAVGDKGVLTVVKDLRLREPVEGVVPLQTGKMDADLVYYLMQSEQTPSLVEIDAKLNAKGDVAVAGGLLFQVLPDHEPNALVELSERLDDLPDLGVLLANGHTPESLLVDLMGNSEYEILEKIPLRFECSCSRERSEQALISIGSAELESLIEEGEAVVDCHYCHQRYVFDREQLKQLLAKARV